MTIPLVIPPTRPRLPQSSSRVHVLCYFSSLTTRHMFQPSLHRGVRSLRPQLPTMSLRIPGTPTKRLDRSFPNSLLMAV